MKAAGNCAVIAPKRMRRSYLSGTFAEMQEKHLKRTKLRKDTPTALSNAKKNVEVFQSRMDELIALAPVDEEIDKLFTELNKKEKFDNSFSTKKRKTHQSADTLAAVAARGILN